MVSFIKSLNGCNLDPVAEFGVKIMWGKIKKVKRDSQCFKNSKNNLTENWVKISHFR
jgi:hypothetical protein